MSLFSILVPEATTNLITNPSFEVDTAGWSAIGATTIAANATKYRRGAQALELTPPGGATAGVECALGTLTAAQPYALSFDFCGALGKAYGWYVYDSGGNVGLAAYTGTGAWARQMLLFSPTVTRAHTLGVEMASSPSTAKFYLDGVQLEANAYATSYVDGSLALSAEEQQAGFAASGVAWTGTAHASTSTRAATSRRGGVWKDLAADFGLYIEQALGLGTPPVQSARVNYANHKLIGSLFEYSHDAERVITLQGVLSGTSLSNLGARYDALMAALRVNPNVAGDDEPVMLRYSGGAITREIAVHYEGGLEGGATDDFSERIALRLVADYPYWTDSLL